MSNIYTTENNTEVNETEQVIHGVLTCLIGKIIAWIILIVSAIYGIKFIGPYIKNGVLGAKYIADTDPSFGMFIYGFSSAIVLLVLIAICENLIKINQQMTKVQPK